MNEYTREDMIVELVSDRVARLAELAVADYAEFETQLSGLLYQQSKDATDAEVAAQHARLLQGSDLVINSMGEILVGINRILVEDPKDLSPEQHAVFAAWHAATAALYEDPRQCGTVKYRFYAGIQADAPYLTMVTEYSELLDDDAFWKELQTWAECAGAAVTDTKWGALGYRQVSVDFNALGKSMQELADMRAKWDELAGHLWNAHGMDVY